MSEKLDVVVIGAGPGGYVAAIHGAQRGLKVGLIERDRRLGGTCLLRGCIPTKALLKSASLLEDVRHASQFGIRVGAPEVDFPTVQKYKNDVITSNTRGIVYLTKKYGVKVIKGHGRLVSPGVISVTNDGKEETIHADNVILATGSRCSDLSFIPMDHERIINSDDILNLQSIPKRLMVMGAGAVGSEFACIYNSFGSKVDLIELQEHILPLEDHEISAAIAKSFKRQGIGIFTGTRVQKVTRKGDEVHVEIEDAKGVTKTLVGDILLVAVGRSPVTNDLGLDRVGVKMDKRGMITVDDHCRTNIAGVYAIGDIIQTPAYAHTASHEGVLVMDHLVGDKIHPIQYDHTPNCTFTHPEVASVGLTERAARERGHDVKTATFPFAANGKAKIAQASEGLIKIVSDKRYNEVLGIHICGLHATDLISEGTLALHLEATVEDLAHMIHPHPTLAEVMGEVAHAALHGNPIHF